MGKNRPQPNETEQKQKKESTLSDDERECSTVMIRSNIAQCSVGRNTEREMGRSDLDVAASKGTIEKTTSGLDLIPIEVFRHSLLPFVPVRDLFSLLSLNKYYKNLVDANECWREKFYLLLPPCQDAYLKNLKLFESVWKSCLFGKIKLTKTALKQVSFSDVSYKKLLRNVFGRLNMWVDIAKVSDYFVNDEIITWIHCMYNDHDDNFKWMENYTD